MGLIFKMPVASKGAPRRRKMRHGNSRGQKEGS